MRGPSSWFASAGFGREDKQGASFELLTTTHIHASSFSQSNILPMTNLSEVAIEVDAAGRAHPRYPQATAYFAVWAETAVEAEGKARDELAGAGYVVLRAPARVREIDPLGWEGYVQAHWAGLRDRLPGQAAVLADRGRPDAPLISLSFYPHE